MTGLIALIILMVSLHNLFPSYSDGSHAGFWDSVGPLITGLVMFVVLLLYWTFSMIGIIELGNYLGLGSDGVLIFALLGPIATPMTIVMIIKGIGEYQAWKKGGPYVKARFPA